MFGGTAALVAAYVGFHAEPTIEGTSVATTRAGGERLLLVLMFNFVLSAFCSGERESAFRFCSSSRRRPIQRLRFQQQSQRLDSRFRGNDGLIN